MLRRDVARERAAVGPTCRMDSATSTRHSSVSLACSIWANICSVVLDGTLGLALVGLVQKYGTSSGVIRCVFSPVSLSVTVRRESRHTMTSRRSSGVRSNSPASLRSGGTEKSLPSGASCGTGWVSALAASSPRASMSKAPRPAAWFTRSLSWDGQVSALGQRMSTSPSLAGRSGVPQDGHSVGMTNSRSVPSRSATTGPTISGMTSPALRSTTVSPISTPLALTTSWLCRVAISTVEPATRTGSMSPNGVTRPVRPTFTRMSTSVVLTSSGGYLYATAQRGTREV